MREAQLKDGPWPSGQRQPKLPKLPQPGLRLSALGPVAPCLPQVHTSTTSTTSTIDVSPSQGAGWGAGCGTGCGTPDSLQQAGVFPSLVCVGCPGADAAATGPGPLQGTRNSRSLRCLTVLQGFSASLDFPFLFDSVLRLSASASSVSSWAAAPSMAQSREGRAVDAHSQFTCVRDTSVQSLLWALPSTYTPGATGSCMYKRRQRVSTKDSQDLAAPVL